MAGSVLGQARATRRASTGRGMKPPGRTVRSHPGSVPSCRGSVQPRVLLSTRRTFFCIFFFGRRISRVSPSRMTSPRVRAPRARAQDPEDAGAQDPGEHLPLLREPGPLLVRPALRHDREETGLAARRGGEVQLRAGGGAHERDGLEDAAAVVGLQERGQAGTSLVPSWRVPHPPDGRESVAIEVGRDAPRRRVRALRRGFAAPRPVGLFRGKSLNMDFALRSPGGRSLAWSNHSFLLGTQLAPSKAQA
jgi:hypothetical protein